MGSFLLKLAAGTFLVLSFVACEYVPGHVVTSRLGGHPNTNASYEPTHVICCICWRGCASLMKCNVQCVTDQPVPSTLTLRARVELASKPRFVTEGQSEPCRHCQPELNLMARVHLVMGVLLMMCNVQGISDCPGPSSSQAVGQSKPYCHKSEASRAIQLSG